MASELPDRRNGIPRTVEKVDSCSTYPGEGYIPSIEDQIRHWEERLPRLPTDEIRDFVRNGLERWEFPAEAEGIFIVPKRSALDPNDRLALGDLQSMISGCSGVTVRNYFRFDLLARPKRCSERSEDSVTALESMLPGSYYAVAAQLGKRHAGKSVSGARNSFASGEFDLDAVVGSAILALVPQRFRSETDLWMKLGAAEYVEEGLPDRSAMPCYVMSHNGSRAELFFDAASTCHCPHGGFGFATGFVPRLKNKE